MNHGMNRMKKIAGTLVLPAVMYAAMFILCYANGKTYFGTLPMWKTLVVNVAVSVTCAMGIGLQFKCGRFDFSGGAIMLVAVIVAGNIAKDNGSSRIIFTVICLAVCIVLSLLVAVLYVFGRLPIIICTIGMALFYESLTCLLFDGGGIHLVSNTSLKAFSLYPLVLVPFIGSVVVYAFFSEATVSGKQSVLLSMNQQSAVNIGVDEKKNVFISYLFSGIIFGFASMIYATTELHSGAFSSLVTVGSLFTNILPVFIGLMLAKYCGDTIGIIMGSLTLCIMSYALGAVFTAEMGSAISIVITGLFILIVNVISAQGGNWIAALKKLGNRKTT